jgi:ribosomal 50S subunit-recycling heat shock protein
MIEAARSCSAGHTGAEKRKQAQHMRLDKYLKVTRLIKRRTVANEACDNGWVTLNGKVARASAEVKPGDIIGISFGDRETKAEVLAVRENVRKEEVQDLFRYC